MRAGDTGTSFGFSRYSALVWSGTLLGKLGTSNTGKHFTQFAYDNADEFVLDAPQDQGMSGGGVINGIGELVDDK